MNLKKTAARFGAALVSALAALAMAAPVLPAAQAAGPTLIVATDNPVGSSIDCGKYNNTALQVYGDLDLATAAATSGSILVCPGTYNLTADVVVNGANKLAVKSAIGAAGARPVINVVSGTDNGIHIINSTGVMVDGLLINAVPNNNSHATYKGVRVDNSTVTLNNLALIGPNAAGGFGIYIDETSASTLKVEKISKTYIAGFSACGICIVGSAKMSISGVTIDGTDKGRVTLDNGSVAGGATGIQLFGEYGPTPALTVTGSVSKSIVRNYFVGISLFDTHAASVTSNLVTAISSRGIYVVSDGAYPASGNKITNNTLTGMANFGIQLQQAAGSPSLYSTSISGNKIVANQYNNGGMTGLSLSVLPTTLPMLTATISKNVFLGFPTGADIVNAGGNATTKESENDFTP